MRKASIFLLIALLLVCLSGCAKKADEPFVVKIGSEEVFFPEFRFYFLLSQIVYESEGGTDIWLTKINGVKAEDVAKDRTFESIARVKITRSQAASMGIAVSDEDKNTARDMAEYYKSMLSAGDLTEIGITDEQLLKIMEETVIYAKVFDEITGNVQISEKDFSTYYEGYIEELQNEAENAAELVESREVIRAQYEDKMKNEVFAETYSRWEADTKMEKNQEAWDTIHILRH